MASHSRRPGARGDDQPQGANRNRVQLRGPLTARPTEETSITEERGNRRAEFEALTAPHLDALYGFAVSRLRDVQAAKDVVQETCLKAFRGFDRFERGTEYKSWLFRILINSITDWWRKVSRAAPHVSLEQADGEGEPRDAPAPLDPERQFFANSFAGEVEAALAALPPEGYIVIYLSFVEGLKYKEIANVVGCPIGTVMSRLYRARQALRHRLAATLSDHDATVRPRRQAATVQPIDLIRARMRDRLRAKGA